MKFILKYHHHYEYIHGKCCHCKCAVYSCQCDWNCWCKLQFKPRIKFWKSEEIRIMWTVVSKLENKSMLIVHVSIVIVLLVWSETAIHLTDSYSSRRVLNCQVSLVENLAYTCTMPSQKSKSQKSETMHFFRSTQARFLFYCTPHVRHEQVLRHQDKIVKLLMPLLVRVFLYSCKTMNPC